MKKLLLFSIALMLFGSCAKEIESPDLAPATKSGKQTLTLTFSTVTYQPSGGSNYGLQFHCATPGVYQVDLNVHNVWMYWDAPSLFSPEFCAYGIWVQMMGGDYSEVVPCAVDYRSFVDLGSIRVNDATVEATAELYDFNIIGIPTGYYGGHPPVGPVNPDLPIDSLLRRAL